MPARHSSRHFQSFIGFGLQVAFGASSAMGGFYIAGPNRTYNMNAIIAAAAIKFKIMLGMVLCIQN
jgi:hypothetical protein